MGVLLSCTDLVKSFGARVLFENLSLTVSDGDRVGLIGPNGSGKTTLLELLAGNDAPDSGTRAVRKLARMAYVPQVSEFGMEDTVQSVLEAALAEWRLKRRKRLPASRQCSGEQDSKAFRREPRNFPAV